MTQHCDNPPVQPTPDLHEVDAAVTMLRRQYLTRSTLRVLALLAVLLCCAALLDVTFRLPEVIRLLALISTVLLSTFLLVGRWRRRGLHRDDVLTLARVMEDRRPQLRGWLAPALELRDRSDTAAQQCVAEANRRLHDGGPIQLRLWPTVSTFCVTIVVFVGIATLWLWAGADGSLAAHRVLLPLSDAQWPARTTVQSDMPESMVHGKGIPLALHARNTTPHAASEPVDAVLTITTTQDGTQTRQVRLEHQQDSQHTALVDLPDTTTSVEYTFATEDANTPTRHIIVRPLPSVASAMLTITAPWTHASVLNTTHTEALNSLPSNLEPALAGSEVSLLVRFKQQVIEPSMDLAWIQTHLAWSGDAPVHVEGDGMFWRVTWLADQDRRVQLNLVDPDGLRALERPQLNLRVVDDQVPEVTLREPTSDLALPPTAVLILAAHAEDDFPLRRIGLRADARVGMAVGWATSQPALTPPTELEATLSFDSINAQPGDLIELRAEAEDLGDATTGIRITQSRARTIRVMDPESWLDMLHGDLTAMAADVRDMEETQDALLQRDQAFEWSSVDAGAQRRLSRDLHATARKASALLETLATGRVQAPDLEQQADEAVRTLDEASALAMVDGSTAAERSSRQTVVRDMLAELADRLGFDQDQWAARRALRTLLQEQRRLQSSLTSTAPEGASRHRALEAQAQAQGQLADQVSRAEQTLSDAAKSTADDTAHQALQDAEAALRESSVERTMRDAQEHLEGDREGLAGSAQQQVVEMLESITNTFNQSVADRRNTVAVLRRKLTELRTLVARLLGRQHDAVTILDGDTPDTTSSTATLQRIRRGVLSAADRASRADSGDRGVELSLRGAAAADALAIRALRQEPHDLTGGQNGALEARTGLQRALDLIDDAQQTLDQAQLQQALQELVARLLEFAGAQDAIAADAASKLPVEAKLSRRSRFTARQLGAIQEALSEDLLHLSTHDPVLRETTVSQGATQRIARRASGAATILLDGRMAPSVSIDQQRVAVSLRNMAQAITASGAQTPKSDPQFARGGGSGASGGPSSAGSESSLPPVAELKVLRDWQAEVLSDTSHAIEADDAAALLAATESQAELAALGAALLKEVAAQRPPPNVEVLERPTPNARLIHMRDETLLDTPNTGPLPSLDVLLGLEEQETAQSLPQVSDDALQALSERLQQSVTALRDGQQRQARRIQRDALDRIDAILRQAQQQQSSNRASAQQQSSSGSAAQQQGAREQAKASGTSGETGAVAGEGQRAAQDPKLGGALEHHGVAWGTLPPRLRQLLEQGRRDGGSTLYADTTERYFRMLLEVDK